MSNSPVTLTDQQLKSLGLDADRVEAELLVINKDKKTTIGEDHVLRFSLTERNDVRITDSTDEVWDIVLDDDELLALAGTVLKAIENIDSDLLYEIINFKVIYDVN